MTKRVAISPGFLARHAFLFAAFLAALFFLQGLFGSLNKSLTIDEPNFISAGYAHLKWGDFRLNPSHPPLMQDLEALPLLFLELNPPRQNDPAWLQAENPVVAFGRQLIYAGGLGPVKIAFWARLPVLLIGTGLVLAIFLWGRRLFGPAPALMGTVMAAFSPNLIAHAKVATEDLGCTAFMFVAVWTFWRALHSERLRDWGLCGVMTGLALLAKYTSLLLGPVFLAILAALWLLDRTRFKSVPVLKGLALITVLAVLMIGAGYNFSFDYSLYPGGIFEIYSDLRSNYAYYFLGRVSFSPHACYSLVAFLLKVPVPTLLLFVLAVVFGLRDRQHRESVIVLLIPVMIIIGVSFLDRQNLGLRRILPAFPYIFLLISLVLAGEPRRLTGYIGIILVCAAVIEAIIIYPHHLSYFNTVAGGPRGGPYLLDDSNIDWGQDLPLLAVWQRAHPGAGPLKLLYHGTAIPEAYGVAHTPMRYEEISRPRPGIYAVSVQYLVYFRKLMSLKPGLNIDWLTRYRPIAHAGNSIYIYRFPSAGAN